LLQFGGKDKTQMQKGIFSKNGKKQAIPMYSKIRKPFIHNGLSKQNGFYPICGIF
jgi:hypothetical protein